MTIENLDLARMAHAHGELKQFIGGPATRVQRADEISKAADAQASALLVNGLVPMLAGTMTGSSERRNADMAVGRSVKAWLCRTCSPPLPVQEQSTLLDFVAILAQCNSRDSRYLEEEATLYLAHLKMLAKACKAEYHDDADAGGAGAGR